jgi:hypothetical protein
MQIELYERMQNPLDGIKAIGEMFAKSGMFGCDNTSAGQVLAVICMTERKSPVELLRTYDIVDGKLRKKALASLADFRAKGGKHKWLKTGDDGKEAVIELTHEGQTVTSRFTIDEARNMGLVRDKSNWVKSPANMLRARAISNGVAMLCPEIFAGDDSEAEDRNVAPLLSPKEPKAESKAEVKADKVVDVETVEKPADEKPADKKFGAADVRLSADGKRLSDETVAALGDVIGSNFTAAMDWLKLKGWVTTGLHEISVERARKIFDKPESFIKVIRGEK